MSKSLRTELIILADRSGSMASIKKDTEKALNDFITEQKKEPGECSVSFYQFDTEYETVFESKALADVGLIEIHPRGGTALLDALGRTINSLHERLLKATDETTPDAIVVICLTDGEERDSKEFKADTIKKLIEEKTTAHGWRFVYFGSNQEAITTAAQYGFAAGNSISFAGTSKGLAGASFAMGAKMSAYRGGKDHSFSTFERSCAMGADDVKSVAVPTADEIKASKDLLDKTPDLDGK